LLSLFFEKSDPNFADKIRHIRDPKNRMAVVWAHCKTKMVCEPDDPKEEGADPDNEEPKKGHGGCGHIQPQIRKEGLKLFVQYKKTKDDDDVCVIFIAFILMSNRFTGGEIIAA
jgi:DNA-directed RNA polymerase II subunit RPB1